MLNVEFTVNGVVRKISIDGHALTSNWRPRIVGFDAPTLAIPNNYGGFAKPEFGSISFNPLLFYDTAESINDYPPPIAGAISVYYTDTTELARELVFTGLAHLKSFDRTSVNYALYGPSYDETIIIRGVGPLAVGQIYEITEYIADDDFTNVGAASNATGVIFTASGTTPTTWTNFSKLAPRWNDTLNNVITNLLTRIPEITTVDTTYARASSPNVLYTLTSERLIINVASDIAAFYSHLFYVIGSTAYLVDLKRNNGTDWDLTEFKFFKEPQYQYNTPIAQITCSSDSVVYSAYSSYPYGTTTSVEAYHETQANIEACLDDILAIENAPRISFDVPMIAGNFPKLGQKITIPDTAHVANLASWIRVRKLQYDFINDRINIEGEGGIAAA